MKKIIYILSVFFAFSILSGILYAETETEYDKAIRYYNSGKYREAVEIFKDYIKTKPEAPAYYRIGYALYELGQYDEANEYFKQAYLIDPSFSPEIVAPVKKEKEITQPSFAPTTSKQEPQVPAHSEITPETSPAPFPGPQPQLQMEPQQQTEEQPIAPVQNAPPGEAQVVTPQRMMQPPAAFPKFPDPTESMPTGIPGMGPDLIAGLGGIMTAIQIVSILLYLFFCFCLYLIAKKLGVPAPWLAFIPVVQIWTIVNCAGKPWWWILLLFIPLLNIIIGVLLWMYIAENMGRSKWLGLLMLLPVINYIFLAMLAFSKTERMSTAEGISTV